MHILHIFNIYNIYKSQYIIKYNSHYTFKNIFLYCTNWKKLLYIFCSFSKIILLSINSLIMLNKFITNPFSFIFDMKINNCEIVVNLWSNTITNNCNHMILFRLAYSASWKTAIRVKIDISKIKKGIFTCTCSCNYNHSANEAQFLHFLTYEGYSLCKHLIYDL